MRLDSMNRCLVYLCSACAGLWMRLPVVTQLLAWLMLADIVAGLMRAAYQRRLSSELGWRGSMQKAGMVLAVLVSILIEHYALHESHLAAMVSMAFVATEGVSILENLHAIGVPIPRPLATALDTLRKASSGEEEETHDETASAR